MKSILTLLTALATTAIAADKPNILFISIDDLRPELGCYGSPQVKTPHIDRIAAQGLRFERAYCQVPICMGSRASILTGLLPTATRFAGDCKAEIDAPQASTLPETFRKAGYTTLSNGKVFHHAEDTADRSWSRPPWNPDINHMASHDPETPRRLSKTKQRGLIYESADVADDAYYDGKVARKTIEDLRQLKKNGEPFFLATGFIRPHLPFYAPKRFWDLYQRDEIEIAENRSRPRRAPKALSGSREYASYHLGDFKVGSDEWHRMMRHGYLASTSYADKLTGDVLEELEKLGLAENTIVVIWGDHGWHLGEHDFWGKHNTMHLATRVPLIIRVPGRQAAVSESLVELIDLFPTLCELAAIKIPETVHGRSFKELFEKPAQAFREAAYCRFNTADTVITERYSYTRYGDKGGEMLYDLTEDPEENVNIAGEPAQAETVGKLRGLLKQRQSEAAGAKIDTDADKPKTPPQTSKAETYGQNVPKPTLVNISYGKHPRHVMEVWKADVKKPTPLVLVIHGGGWKGGSKERLSRSVDTNALLKAGISVAAINYRLMKHAEGVSPPVKAPLEDAARALQFIRSKADEWNIDPQRIAAAGGSAGACSSLWLAYHDDMAQPDSPDPVARQSTRLYTAAVLGPQTSLDPKQMKEWIPNITYGGHAFGKANFGEFLASRDSILPLIEQYSPYAWVSADDPPVALFYNTAPEMGKPQKDATHSANFGLGLQGRCKAVGIPCTLVHPGLSDPEFKTPTAFLIHKLTP